MKNCIIFIALAVLFYTTNAFPSNYGNTGVSYGGNAGRIEVVKPMISLDTPMVQTGYGAQQQQVVRPALDIPVVQTGYGAQQQQVVRPALDIPVVQTGYGAQQQVVRPALDTVVQVQTLEPELRNLCLNRRENIGVFYLPHPSRQSWYIQCDEYGQAFLKECPAGTIFTQNLVCENINDLHPVEPVRPVVTPALDQTVGAYGSAPVFAAEAGSAISQARVEIVTEAPEFKHLCSTRNAYGAQVSTVFYVPHPTRQSSYIQCDEFGRAFLKECPAGTIFSQHLVCEAANVQQPVEVQTTVVAAPQLDQPIVPQYGASQLAADTVTRVEIVQEAPEFRELCLNKNAYGAQVSTVFYVPHPSNKGMYIQCDEFGRAFLKECPAGTIFTSRLTCEKVTEIVETPIMQDQIVQRPIMQDQTSYTQVPVVTKVIETPIIQQNSYAQPIPEVPRPILRDRPVTYTQTVVATPILRDQVVQHSSYGQAMVRPIMRDQPVVRPAY